MVSPERRPTPALFTRFRALPSFAWFAPAYLLDWIVIFLLGLLSTYVSSRYPYERDAAHYLHDPAFQWPTIAGHETVNSGAPLDYLSFYLPMAVILVVSALRGSVHELHSGLIGICASRAIMRLTVEFMKNRVGRLRPDFFARCQWDPVKEGCTGVYALVKDGRRSFPSGHSASAWQGLFFLSLFLAGKNGAFSPSSPRRSRSFLSSQLLRLSIALAPLFLSLWISITRMEDHMHHYQDVIVGGSLGAFFAWVVYGIYWPNPFKGEEGMGHARWVYGTKEEGIRLAEEGEEEERERLVHGEV